jgi:hemerythrin-like domain-containing protein
MQDAIELLMQEHRKIEQVLDALDAYANTVKSGGDFERADLARFVEFIADYADANHHSKEETILFTTMQDNGFPRGAGPVAVMLHEHDVGRNLVEVLKEIASTDGEWPDDAAARIGEAAHGFTQLNNLPDAAYESVVERCNERQQQATDSGLVARLEGLGDELTQRYR